MVLSDWQADLVPGPGWSWSAERDPALAVQSASHALPVPGVLSLPCRPPRLKLFGYRFACSAPAQSGQVAVLPAVRAAAAPTRTADPSATSLGSRTRIAPPSELVKLEDRLQFLLQPPLETILSTAELEFPFRPFPYQLQGVAFLYPRHAAILADEMGLGKTMQAAVALRLLLHAGELKRVLLVCPKPLVTNWQRELHLWAPELPALVIEGDQARRRWQWQRHDAPLTIANYELLQRDRDLLVQENVAFDLVVLDEAQRIKNRNNTTAQVVHGLRRTRSWALTGTPIENSTDDLVGIFEFLLPGYLSQEMKPRKLAQLVSDYILRRQKEEVLTELPPKTIRDAHVELTPAQRETYRLAEEEGVLRLSELGEGASIQHVFELVLRLKQICNFDPATGQSAKLERLQADLEEVAASGRKALVFSQWVGTLKTLGRKLAPLGVLEYHGQVPPAKRDGIIQQFRSDKSKHVLLISYGAGGVGLNLQFCEYVFLFDRWWNPALEDQAINRAHRIGAAGPVTVTKMLSCETIEERIDEVLQAKRAVFETVLSETSQHADLGLSQRELFGLFRLRVPGEGRQAA